MSSKVHCVGVGLLQTNCYIVDSTDSDGKPFLAVIDPGDSPDRIVSALKGEPTHIILTHSHFDHIGALKELLSRFPEAKLAVGEKENLDPEYIARIATGVLGSFFFSRGYDQLLSEIRRPDILLKDGDSLGPFEVLHTPGHTDGSICLYDKASRIRKNRPGRIGRADGGISRTAFGPGSGYNGLPRTRGIHHNRRGKGLFQFLTD